MGLDVTKSDDGPMQIVDVEDEFTDYVKNIEQNTILTGIPFIDKKMPITVGTNAAILGAPGSGKTTLALNILKNCSAKNMTTIFFSLDMHRKRMFEKIMYDVTGLNRVQLYDAFKHGRGKDLVRQMKEQYGNIWFYDRSGTKPEHMANYIKTVEDHTGTKVKLVMIDYLERVASDKSSDTEASKDVAQKVQDLVMDMDIAAITLVQPNKNAYSGGPDAPLENMGGIKGSSYLSQSYRNIISLWRPGYSPDLSEYDIFMELAILKNDLGELGKTIMKFDGAKGRIGELEDFERDKYKELMNYKAQLKAQKDGDGWD
jgi:replicative DNA helicase